MRARRHRGSLAASWGPCYHPPPVADPWCSGPTCQPVTLEIAGSNPVGSAILSSIPLAPRPPARTGRRLFRRSGTLPPVSVRDPGYDPRASPRRETVPIPIRRRGPDGRRWLIPAALVGGARRRRRSVIGVGVFGGGSGGSGGSPSAARRPASPRCRRRPARPPGSPASPSDGDTGASQSPEPSRRARRRRPDATGRARATRTSRSCPVTNFRSPLPSVKPIDVRALAAAGTAVRGLVLVEARRGRHPRALGLARALGKQPGDRRLAARRSRRTSRSHRSRLGFLRADEVGPSVRALALGRRACSAADRVRSSRVAAHRRPLEVPTASRPAYDPARAWTMVAGGDILLDRGVSLAIEGTRRGANFPFDGGTVEITGRCKDCSPMGWDLPYTKRTGNAGVVRELIKGADIAIANFENPAPDDWRFHGKGTVFSANPKHIAGARGRRLRLGVAGQQPHRRRRATTGSSRRWRTSTSYGIAHAGAGQEHQRRPTRRRCSRPAA